MGRGRSYLVNALDLITASDTAPGATTIQLGAGDAAKLPAVPFYAVFNPFDDGLREYVWCTGVNLGLDRITGVERQIQGEPPQTQPAGSTLRIAYTAQILDDLWERDLDSLSNVQAGVPDEGDVILFDEDTGDWIAGPPPGRNGLLYFDYRNVIPYDSTPAAGRLSRNGATPSATTIVTVHKQILQGPDASWIYQQFKEGDRIRIQTRLDAGEYETYQIVSVAERDPYFDFTVTYVNEGATFPNTDNDRVILLWFPATPEDNSLLRMRWMGIWQPGTYERFDVVTDSSWLMVANTQTTDRAAPQPDGAPEFVFDVLGDPVWSTLNDPGYVATGHEYTFDELFFVNGIRAWIPDADPTIVYNFTIENWTNPAAPVTLESISFNPDDTGWTTVNIPAYLFGPGDVIRFMLKSEKIASPSTWQWPWTYDGTGGGDPGSNKYTRTADWSELRISDIDENGVDRSADLAQVGIGDTFQLTEVEEASRNAFLRVVGTPTDNGGWWTFPTQLEASNSTIRSGKVVSIQASYGNISVTDYVIESNYWLGQPDPPSGGTVKGLIESAAGGGIVVNDNAYGVDIQGNAFSTSPDWDPMAYSGGSTGGGGGDHNHEQTYFRLDAGNNPITGSPVIEGNVILPGDQSVVWQSDPMGTPGNVARIIATAGRNLLYQVWNGSAWEDVFVVTGDSGAATFGRFRMFNAASGLVFLEWDPRSGQTPSGFEAAGIHISPDGIVDQNGDPLGGGGFVGSVSSRVFGNASPPTTGDWYSVPTGGSSNTLKVPLPEGVPVDISMKNSVRQIFDSDLTAVPRIRLAWSLDAGASWSTGQQAQSGLIDDSGTGRVQLSNDEFVANHTPGATPALGGEIWVQFQIRSTKTTTTFQTCRSTVFVENALAATVGSEPSPT